MTDTSLIARAAKPLSDIVAGIRPEQLTARTPCTEYDVRRLLNHLLYWGPGLEAAGRKESVPPPAEPESEIDLTTGDWAAALRDQLDRTARTWSAPEAWEGMASMGQGPALPAEVLGGMLADELVVHGWDLAVATGQLPTWDDDLLEYVYAAQVDMVEQGREMGMYAPEIPVPDSAPTLDRILGRTGRDPGWTA